ncbi:MAG: hypothetical protein MJD61_20275 [Proteobacteria bacterium]|nr:hypothetical protein [Pseudomonadota bacterium]
MLTLLLVLALATAFASRNPRQAVRLAVFLVPWEGLEADLGLRITAYRVAAGALLIVSLLPSSRAARRISPWPRTYIAFLAFAAIWTVLQIPELPEYSVYAGSLRSGTTRLLSQCAILILQFAPLAAIPKFVGEMDHIAELGRVYIMSCLALAAVGFIQIAVWFLAGVDPLPVGVLEAVLGHGSELGRVQRSAYLNTAGATFLRMSSLGGEPKGLGQSLVVALLMLQVARGVTRSRPATTAVWAILGLATMLTWSTSAFFLWTLGTGTHLIVTQMLKSVRGPRPRALGVGPRVLTGAVLLTTGLAFSGLFGSPEDVGEVMEQRTIAREAVEDFDAVVLDFLRAEPDRLVAGAGVGAVHFYAHRFIPAKYAHYMVGNVFAAKSTLLRVVSETGVIGLALLGLAIAGTLRGLSRALMAIPQTDTRRASWLDQARQLAGFAYTLVPCFLARTYIFGQMMLTLGAVIACTLAVRELKRSTLPESATHDQHLRPIQSSGRASTVGAARS